MRTINITDKLANWYVIILLVGFLVTSTTSVFLGTTEGGFSVVYRAFVVVFSLFFFLNTIFSKRFVKLSIYPALAFLFFWFIYSIRIIHDLYFNPIVLFPETTASHYSLFAFGVVLLPAISVYFIVLTSELNMGFILKWVYKILFLCVFVTLLFRSGSASEGRNLGGISIGLISYGHYAASLVILSIFNLIKTKVKFHQKIIYYLGVLIGFSGIVVSASKSPLLVLGLVLTFFIIFWYGKIKSAFLLMFVALIINFYFIEIVSVFATFFKSNFLERLLYSIEMGEDSARSRLLEAGFMDFVEGPLWGNAMLIQQRGLEGSYPHNLIVEAFMATGLLGGFFLLLWIIKGIKISINIIKKHSELTWIALLFLQYFLLGLFSKSLYSNDLFWFCSLLLLLSSRRLPLIKKISLK
ncbi:hypothetical protein [Planobacterium oryzisoli]|uniref:O-antigen ligase family protein n=1 Tax=Planobacterium oryzisoli TaxID=2771435 RepID=A0A931EA85_9FLAO|nr:hypothetical protein [Planobacterium oryzisoli]MBF5027128.1 hypothetical protein [Planobacterium oryzisoli]